MKNDQSYPDKTSHAEQPLPPYPFGPNDRVEEIPDEDGPNAPSVFTPEELLEHAEYRRRWYEKHGGPKPHDDETRTFLFGPDKSRWPKTYTAEDYRRHGMTGSVVADDPKTDGEGPPE